MDLFSSCKNCKRCRRRRRNLSPRDADDENNDDVIKTGNTSRRGRVVVDVDNGGGSGCCSAAVMYFYAGSRTGNGAGGPEIGSGRRRPDGGRSRVKFGAETEIASSSPPAPAVDGDRTGSSFGGGGSSNELPVVTSILKNSSGDSPASNSSGSRRGRSPASGQSPSVIRSSSSSTAISGPCPEKRASFNEAVDVIVADDSGRPIVADHIRLKRGPEDDTTDAASPTSGRRRTAGPPPSACRRPAPVMMVYPPASRCRHAFSLASADVQRRPDGSKYLRAVIRPTLEAAVASTTVDGGPAGGGGGVDPASTGCRRPPGLDERLVVRAAGRGSRLIVGAYRPEPLGDGTNYLRQYIDRFRLPHIIETRTIRANLAPTGVLVVTASINDSSDTDSD